MDPATPMPIDLGRINNQLLIQSQYSPMPVGEQVAILFCGTKGLLANVPIDKVRDFQDMFLSTLRASHAEDVLAQLTQGKLTDEVTATLTKVAADVAAQYK